MCNLEYSVEPCANAEYMSPGGHMTKLPVLQCGAFVVAELEPIVGLVEKKGVSLTSHLDADEKQDLRAYLCLTEKIFTNAEVSSAITPITSNGNSNFWFVDSCTFVGWTSKHWTKSRTNDTDPFIHGHWIIYKIGESDDTSRINWKYLIGRRTPANRWWRKCENVAWRWQRNWAPTNTFTVTRTYDEWPWSIYQVASIFPQLSYTNLGIIFSVQRNWMHWYSDIYSPFWRHRCRIAICSKWLKTISGRWWRSVIASKRNFSKNNSIAH